MDAERVEVLHVADGDAVVKPVAHHLVFYLLPSLEALLDEHLRREREGFLADALKLVVVVGKAGAESAQGIGCAHDDGVAEVLGGFHGLGHILAGLALDGLDLNLIELLDEALAVLGVHDGFDGGAEHLDIVFLQYAALLELDAAVERGLSAEAQQDAVGAFLGDDALDEVRLHGEEINLVGHALRGLHGGDIGVDEHRLDALLTQGFQGL